MKEIGSEFWDIPVSEDKNSLFPASVHWFVSGRNALAAIISELSVKSVAIPFWCCESIIIPFVESGIQVFFYNDSIPETDAVLVMDYFGYKNKKKVEMRNAIVIRDLTHSIFSEPYSDADYYFGSMRKWAGFWTGGYAWGFKKPVQYDGCNEEYIESREKAMTMKKEYINGSVKNTDIGEKKFLDIFSKAEKNLEKKGIYYASKRDIDAAYFLDVNWIKKRRRENAKYLLASLADIAIFPILDNDDCPLFVPIRIKNRDKIKNELIKNSIYCPVHWPISRYHSLSINERLFYEEELSLVCDQRYNQDDMEKIVNVIKDRYIKYD